MYDKDKGGSIDEEEVRKALCDFACFAAGGPDPLEHKRDVDFDGFTLEFQAEADDTRQLRSETALLLKSLKEAEAAGEIDALTARRLRTELNETQGELEHIGRGYSSRTHPAEVAGRSP